MRKFLASVGNAQLLGKREGKIYHIADARTLTESTLTFSNTMEEVRAGEGGNLYGRFAHDSGLTVTLTDAMFDINYVALQIGGQVEAGGAGLYEAIATTDYTVSGNVVSIVGKPVAKLGNACGLDKYVIWVKKMGSCDTVGNEYVAIEADDADGETYTLPIDLGGLGADELCVRYYAEDFANRRLMINADFIPAECILLLTTKLYAGDANAPETGKPIGSITVKIPRFSLDGNFDLTMAMSSAATMSLSGSALAVSEASCDGAGVYAEIVEVDASRDMFDGIVEAYTEAATTAAATADNTYIVYRDGAIGAVKDAPADKFTVAAGKLTFTKTGATEPTEITIDTLD